MALSRSRNRSVHTIPIALTVYAFEQRPRTLQGLDALMAARGTPPDERAALRRAFLAGGIVFFVESTRRFATPKAQVSPDWLIGVFDAALTDGRAYLVGLGRGYLAGEMDDREFAAAVEEDIERTHWEASLLLLGPLIFLLPVLSDFVRDRISRHVGFFRRLMADLASGRQRKDASLLTRLAMYASAGHATYYDVSREVARMDGFTQERNVLGIAEHCGGCLDETERGWVPIGSLVPIGERTCLSNCKCHLEFR